MDVGHLIESQLGKYRAFQEEFKKESDRGCAVLVLCVLEEGLRELIAAAIVDPERGLRNLAPPGRLGMAIENAYQLGQLSEDEAKTFSRLTDIRNAFAHRALQQMTFESAPVSDHCGQLRMPVGSARELLADAGVSNRTLFLMAAAVVYVAMSVRIHHTTRIPKATNV